MSAFSRRQLAKFGADALLNGKSAASVARQLSAVLIANHREKDADLLIQDIEWELENRGRLAVAQVTSAHELSAGLRSQITKQLQKSLKIDQIELQENVDSSVIGGLRIQTAQHSWDQTVTAQLNQLKEVF